MLGRGALFDLHRNQTPLQWLSPQSRAADIAFCNLECVFTPNRSAASWKPQLLAPPATVRYLRAAGIDVVSMANNHAFDAGEAGVQSTRDILQKSNIAEIGIKTTNSASWPVWQRSVGGRRLAWLAASAYGPWQADNTIMRNVVDPGLIKQVHTLTAEGDTVFISLHWGNEYSRTVTAGLVQLAHGLIDAGAVAIIGHHPHVQQRVEVYRGRPIFYSLGNFVFDRLPGRVQDGIAAQISVLPSDAVSYRILSLRHPVKIGATLKESPLAAPKYTTTPLPDGEKLVKVLTGRFVKNVTSRQEIVWSQDKSGEGVIRAYVKISDGWRCLAEGHHPAIFDMQVGDVDRDGLDEIVLGLYQRSKLDVRISSRLYVYSVSDQGFFEPRWRGSGLSRPFWRFQLLPTGEGDDLVAQERDNRRDLQQFQWVSIYRWNGFGFKRLWDSPVRGSVQGLKTGRDGRGSFIVFMQVQGNKRRQLILRRPDTSQDPFESVTPFTARVLTRSITMPTAREETKGY